MVEHVIYKRARVYLDVVLHECHIHTYRETAMKVNVDKPASLLSF